jgi:hypothetical protein
MMKKTEKREVIGEQLTVIDLLIYDLQHPADNVIDRYTGRIDDLGIGRRGQRRSVTGPIKTISPL